MRVIVAEDDLVSRRLLVRTLEKWHYEVVSVGDGQSALDLLLQENGESSIAIIDWVMPGLDGPEVCKRVRARHDAPFNYIILLSGKDKQEDIVAGLDAGADDYLIKPFDPAELRCRIRAAERIVVLHDELQRTNHELHLLATTDDLTRQPNRGAVMDKLDKELATAKAEGESLAIALTDIDHFKHVNDTYGHTAGDQVLVEFTHRISRELRSCDVVGRYGGEEFLIILPDVPKDSYHDVIDRIRESISLIPFTAEGKSLPITASFGAAWLAPGQSCGKQNFIRIADEMLYKAKEGGRNRVESILVKTEGQ